eukprot:scaffold29544_cov50-Phaeocystis_antarctica.AAC.2
MLRSPPSRSCGRRSSSRCSLVSKRKSASPAYCWRARSNAGCAAPLLSTKTSTLRLVSTGRAAAKDSSVAVR